MYLLPCQHKLVDKPSGSKSLLNFFKSIISTSLHPPYNSHASTDFVLILLKQVMFLSDEWPMLETLDYTIRICSTPTFLYFD